MKQFMAFYGSIYYPSGGMDDFIGDYDTQEDALAAINKKVAGVLSLLKHEVDL